MSSLLNTLSFSHVRLFVTLYQVRKAKEAANVLGISSSAVSRGLSQMREIFEDALFEHRQGGMHPTDKAEHLIDDFVRLERIYQSFAQQASTFVPESAEGHFTILAYDEFSWAVHEVINRFIRPLAPKLQFTVQLMTYDCSHDLAEGTVDFAVVYEGFSGPGLVHDAFSFPSSLYLICRKDHPLAQKKRITEAQLSHYPLVELDNPKDVQCPLLQDVCLDQGLSMELRSTTSSVASACQLISESDAVTLICNQFTYRFASSLPTLTCIELPERMTESIRTKCSEERPLGNYLVYSERERPETFHWVRERLFEGLKALWDETLASNKGE